MTAREQRFQSLGSILFALVAVTLLLCAILWPPSVANILRSRLAVALLSVLSGGFAGLIHPELSAGLAFGLREFHKALRDVSREIGGDDDDHGPHAA